MLDIGYYYQLYAIPKEKETHSGLDAFFHNTFGRLFLRNGFSRKSLKIRADAIYSLSELHADLCTAKLALEISKVQDMSRLNRLTAVNEIDYALSLICEVAFRELGMRPYSVQIMGALAQYYRYIIEMAPGEGKTITAAISSVLMAWSGKPCHVITSNDYLASRDAEIMSPLYHACNLSVASITAGLQSPERRNIYRHDIVYGTSKEFLADFLRDQMQNPEEQTYDEFLFNKLDGITQESLRVMRGLYYAIVDEADSVLCDEAVTPLIISIPIEDTQLEDASLSARSVLKKFHESVHYKLDEYAKTVDFLDAGFELISHFDLEFPDLWRSTNRKLFLLIKAIMAENFYHNNKDYVVIDNKVNIVDGKTGRLMKDRSWGAGLHQAIEAKEGIEISKPTQTHTRMSFQRYFRFYNHLSGMSGTLQNIEKELWSIYALKVLKVPKRVPNTYELMPREIFSSQDDKYEAIIRSILTVHEHGRPILVGTNSIAESHYLADLLVKAGVEVTVLNALKHQEEAEIIAQAGDENIITIATNIAGRGTDIKLNEKVVCLGGLHVIATELFESKRIDRQLYGRASRQGQPGSVKILLSLQDNLLRANVPVLFLDLLGNVVHTRIGRYVSLLIYDLSQLVVEYKMSRLRKKVLENDFSMRKMLSFVR